MSILVETVGYLAAALTTLSFLPQALMTIRTRDTSSLSLGMYSMFTTGVFFWLVYGLATHDRAVTLANALTLMLASTILALKVIHTLRRRRSLGAPGGLGQGRPGESEQ